MCCMIESTILLVAYLKLTKKSIFINNCVGRLFHHEPSCQSLHFHIGLIKIIIPLSKNTL